MNWKPPPPPHIPGRRSPLAGILIVLLMIWPTVLSAADLTLDVPPGTDGRVNGREPDWSETDGPLHWRGLSPGVHRIRLNRMHDDEEPGGCLDRAIRLPAAGLLLRSRLGEEWPDCNRFQPLLPASTEDEQLFRAHWPSEELVALVVRERLLLLGRNTSLRRPDRDSGDGITWTCDDGQTLIRVDQTQDWGEDLCGISFADQAWLMARGPDGSRFFRSTWGNHWEELPPPPGPAWSDRSTLVVAGERLIRLDPSADGRYASGFSTADGKRWQAEPAISLGGGGSTVRLHALSFQDELYLFPHGNGLPGRLIRIRGRQTRMLDGLPWQGELPVAPFVHGGRLIMPFGNVLFCSRDGQDWPRLDMDGEERLSGFLRCRVVPVADRLLPAVSWRGSAWFFNRFPQAVDRFDLVHQPDPLPDRMVRSLLGFCLTRSAAPAAPGMQSGLRTIPQAPELTGGQEGVYCYQDLDAGKLFTDDDFPGEEVADDREPGQHHPGLCLSASIRVGTDDEFDEVCRRSAEEAETISQNNRLAVIFEQFGNDGKRLRGRRNRFGFTVDLFGRVERLADDSACESEAGTVHRAVVIRRSQDRRILHEYRPGVTARESTPRGAELNRWTRGWCTAVPAFSDTDFSPEETEQRYVVYITPLKPEIPTDIRLTHAVDGLMLERAMEPAPYTENKTLVLGPDAERDEDGTIRIPPTPVSESIPYRSR